MTNDVTGSDGHVDHSANAPRDQSLGLGEPAPLNVIAELLPLAGAGAKSQKRSIAGNKHYRRAVDGLADAAVNMARAKNVAISMEDCAKLARLTVESLGASTIHGIAKCLPQPVTLAAATLNRLLDIWAATQVIHLLRSFEGYDHFDHGEVVTQAQAWMRNICLANFSGDTRYRWPDPGTMVTDYYKTGASGPVAVKYPDAYPVVTMYRLDRPACRRAAKVLARAKSRVPVQHLHSTDGQSEPLRDPVFENKDIPVPTLRPMMTRCPIFDRKTGNLVREGRLVMKLPEGVVCTTWWRNGELHRDPREGPAWHRQDPGFERVEYICNGALHRDPQDGPALIDGNFDGRGIRIEEYLTCGMPHRPSTLGPAAVHTAPNGQRILEVYFEHGRLHRDPARGPALITYDDDGHVTNEEYWQRGERLQADAAPSDEVAP